MTTEQKYKELIDFIYSKRNEEKANMEQEAIEEDGFFDADSYSGGNFDDCYYMGKENGEAEFIERLIGIIEKE